MEIFNCRKSSAFCIKPNGTLEIQISARDGKSPRNAVLRLDLFTKNSTHIKDKDEIGEWKLELYRVTFFSLSKFSSKWKYKLHLVIFSLKRMTYTKVIKRNFHIDSTYKLQFYYCYHKSY